MVKVTHVLVSLSEQLWYSGHSLSKAQEIIASDAGGLLLNEQYTGSIGESGFVLSTMDSDVKLTGLPLGTENLMGYAGIPWPIISVRLW